MPGALCQRCQLVGATTVNRVVQVRILLSDVKIHHPYDMVKKNVTCTGKLSGNCQTKGGRNVAALSGEDTV